MYPHRIRLRGPWEHETNGQPPTRITLPSPWPELMRGEERVVVRRRFGYPGRIDANERVWLIAEGVEVNVMATLNGNELRAERSPVRCFADDVTTLLKERNLLELELVGPFEDSSGSSTPLEIALEIRATAWLENVRRQQEDGDWVTGRVVGESPGPLDLYLLAEGRNVGYQAIGASPAGEPFRFAVGAEDRNLRVELVHVAQVWYVVELG
jgi:hypothetical protein